MSQPPVPAAEPEQSSKNAGRVLWGMFSAVAFLVFKLTADPVLAVSAFCLKFAVGDVAIAWRLLNADPRFVRGGIVGMFHLSLGGMKSLAASLGAAFVIGVILGQGFRLQGVARGQALETTSALLTLAAWSWGAAALVSLAGTVIAWQMGQRIWLSKGTLICLRRGDWPPRPTDAHNRVRLVILLELTVVLTFALASLYVWLVKAGAGPPAVPGAGPTVVGVLLGGALPVALALLLSLLGGAITRAIAAASPEDCWPDDSGEPPF